MLTRLKCKPGRKKKTNVVLIFAHRSQKDRQGDKNPKELEKNIWETSLAWFIV